MASLEIRDQKSPRYSDEFMQKLVEGMNWDAFWTDVISDVSKEADAMERARAKSKELGAHHVVL
jgi:hypothetical protein